MQSLRPRANGSSTWLRRVRICLAAQDLIISLFATVCHYSARRDRISDLSPLHSGQPLPLSFICNQQRQGFYVKIVSGRMVLPVDFEDRTLKLATQLITLLVVILCCRVVML